MGNLPFDGLKIYSLLPEINGKFSTPKKRAQTLIFSFTAAMLFFQTIPTSKHIRINPPFLHNPNLSRWTGIVKNPVFGALHRSVADSMHLNQTLFRLMTTHVKMTMRELMLPWQNHHHHAIHGSGLWNMCYFLPFELVLCLLPAFQRMELCFK